MRPGAFNPLLVTRKLTSQYVIDAAVNIQDERLRYIYFYSFFMWFHLQWLLLRRRWMVLARGFLGSLTVMLQRSQVATLLFLQLFWTPM